MYNVALYEEGRFCTNIGNPVSNPLDAVGRIKSALKGIDYMDLTDYVGVKYDRAGTTCALIVCDEDGAPVRPGRKED